MASKVVEGGDNEIEEGGSVECVAEQQKMFPLWQNIYLQEKSISAHSQATWHCTRFKERRVYMREVRREIYPER